MIIAVNCNHVLNSKTFPATTAVAFVLIDKIKAFIETLTSVIHGHAVDIGQVFGVNKYCDSVAIIVLNALQVWIVYVF